MLNNEGDRLTRVATCTPRKEFALASNNATHNIGHLGDPAAAVSQHDSLKAALRSYGCEVIDLSELRGHPNSVFTRDTSLTTPEGYVQLRLGLPSRLGEAAWMGETLVELGLPCVGRITAPGTVEGGDVVLAGDVAFVAHSVRTNQEGIRQLSAILKKMNYAIRVITLPDTILHLDRVLNTIGPKTLLYCSSIIPLEMLKGFDVVEIDYDYDTTANIICLHDKEVLVNQSNSVVVERLRARGFTVHVLDLSEFAKGMGGPNCLIMPVERVKAPTRQDHFANLAT